MSVSSSVLVTGGAGFIGSHLCEALLRQGRRVVLLDNFCDFYDPAIKEENLREIERTARACGGELLVHRGDIRSAEDLRRAFGDLGDAAGAAVIHLAAMAGVRPSIENPLLYQDVNLNGTLQILEACRNSGIDRLLFASSSSVYGNNEKVPFSESDVVDHPISPYAATKKAGELFCFNYHHLYRFKLVCLRFFTVYGPRQRPDLAIHKFARLMAAGRPLPFFGDGSTRRDYTYVTDTLQGILASLELVEQAEEPLYEIFNLGESQTVSLREMVEELAGAMGVEPLLDRRPMQPGDVLCTYADISCAKKRLGYAPKLKIDEGIPLFVQWFKGTQGRG